MTAAAAIKRVDLLDVFIERAEARAMLWSIGELRKPSINCNARLNTTA